MTGQIRSRRYCNNDKPQVVAVTTGQCDQTATGLVTADELKWLWLVVNPTALRQKQLAYQVPAPAQSGLTLTEAEQLLPIQQRYLPLEKKLHRHR